MNPPAQTQAASGQPQATGLSLDDVIFTLFRQKWLVLGSICLGLAGAVAIRLVRPPLFVSKAKLMVHYVADRGAAAGNPEQTVTQVGANVQTAISAEIEILQSLDVAIEVAEKVGPAKILAKKGGGTNLLAAAAAVCKGIEVEPPKSSIITVAFKHPDADMVQPILRELLQTYMKKHAEVHFGGSKAEGYWFGQRDEWRGKLKQTEEELKQLKADANLPFPDDAQRFFESQNMKIQEELATARVDLAQRQAMLGNLGPYVSKAAGTNASIQAVPPEKLSDYGDIVAELDGVKRRERELYRLGYKDEHPLIQNARNRYAELSKQKARLESEYPSLTQFSVPGGTNAPGMDVAAELAAIRGLAAKVAALELSLTNIQTEASRMMVFEPRIKELQRRQAEEQKNYDRAMANIDMTQQGESQAASQAINMSEVQSPTPPGLDYKKLIKLVGMVLAGCIGMGLGLAFAMDHVVDRSIKRSHDIEKHLRMPVFLTIPDTSWAGRFQPKWFRRRQAPAGNGTRGAVNPRESTGTALAPWKPVNHLQNYAEGLGERVMTYFEVNNMNLKKPKLVAVTGCGSGTGVSTLATGLAASLSKTGEGNVLLVDMNVDEGVAHPFHKGKPGCGISDALEPENRAEAQVGEKLFLASITGQEASRDTAEPLPMRFNHLMPKLKASDYDYIIFDMPPVSPTNATPRMASHMDIVLLILESEKTGHHAAARATALMRESRANVAAVLNKYREHLPAAMAQE